ncbi:MAG: S16 family serine protease [Candidatus Diapherotrites archaeon]
MKSFTAKCIFLIFLLVLTVNASAIITESSLDLFAVTDAGDAMTANLTLTIKNGNGKVWSSVTPLVGTTTQNTERIAVELAKNYFTGVEKYDYHFQIQSSASLVEGPSAGAAMALLVISMLQDKTIPDDVGLTGTITLEGGVGSVGGVFEKSKKASEIGKKLFMIPRGEARQIVKLEDGVQSINLVEYAEENWGLKVVEVDDIDDVISYAFSDIEQIDVNKEFTAIPEFIPASVQRDAHLDVMNELTKLYINKADSKINEAKNALSGSLIQDHGAIGTLYEILNSGEKAISEARLLIDQNYLYSAANYSFLAYVNAALVHDIAINPSLLNLDSEIFITKVDELESDIQSLQSDLSNNVPLDYLEWHISAQQRLTYADNQLTELKNTEIVIIGGGDDTFAALERITEYEYAKAWYEVASDFYGISKSTLRKARPDNSFEELASEKLTKAEDALQILNEEANADIFRRADSAKTQFNRKWYLGSLFDSAAAVSLAESELAIKDKTADELIELLDKKITETEQTMAQSKMSFIWSRLYLDHAKYYYNAAVFYKENNLGMRSLDAAKNGIGLAYLAEGIVEPSIEIYNYYATMSPEDYIQENKTVVSVKEDSPYLMLLLVLILALTILLVVLTIVKIMYTKKHPKQSIEHQIGSMKKIQHDLDTSLASKKISANKYHELSNEYQKQIDLLLSERVKRSHKIVEIDNLNARLHSYRQALRDLEKHYAQELILEEDYKRNVHFYKESIDYLEKLIENEQKDVKKIPKPLK